VAASFIIIRPGLPMVVTLAATRPSRQQKAPDSVRNQGLVHLVAWGGIERTTAGRANPYSRYRPNSMGTRWGTTKLAIGKRANLASNHSHSANLATLFSPQRCFAHLSRA
jgi:hypothetical protein